MKNILLPTDFSELGNIAYSIAKVIAKATQANITALSIVPGPSGAVYGIGGELTNDEGNDYAEWHKKLNDSKEKLEKWKEDKPEITDTISTIGQIDKTLLRIGESNDFDLIVMGTDGQFGNAIWTNASHTEYISNHSEVPVLSLKCDRSDIDFKKIVLVSDFLELKSLNLDVLKSIQSAYQSEIVLLKILTPSQVRTTEDIHLDMQSFAKANKLENFVMETHKSENVEAGIQDYLNRENIDMIAIGSHQGHGLSKLFRGSISDDLVNHLFHPILTFPL